MITPKHLKTNKHFNSLDHIQRKIMTKKKSLEEINRGVNMTRLKSLYFWIKTCSPSENIRLIVEEILLGNQRKCNCWLENDTCKCNI